MARVRSSWGTRLVAARLTGSSCSRRNKQSRLTVCFWTSASHHPAPYAEWVKRVGGYLVDVAVLVPAYVVAIIGAALMSTDNGAVSAIGLVIALVGYVGAIGIGLIGEQTGQPIGAGLTFVRMLAHVLDSLPCYLGYLWPLWDAKRQTFADKIMSTVVIEQQKA